MIDFLRVLPSICLLFRNFPRWSVSEMTQWSRKTLSRPLNCVARQVVASWLFMFERWFNKRGFKNSQQTSFACLLTASAGGEEDRRAHRRSRSFQTKETLVFKSRVCFRVLWCVDKTLEWIKSSTNTFLIELWQKFENNFEDSSDVCFLLLTVLRDASLCRPWSTSPELLQTIDR